MLRWLRRVLFYRHITQVEAISALDVVRQGLKPPKRKPELARPKVRTFAAWSAQRKERAS